MNDYLQYRREIDQLKERSIETERKRLRHVLRWALDLPFTKVIKKRPTYPKYVLTLKNRHGLPLANASARRLVRSGKQFFTWLTVMNSKFRILSRGWLQTLKLPRLPEQPKERVYVSFDEIMAMAAAPVHTVVERRIQAAAAFLFLSGARVGAFVTLPISAIDLTENPPTVKQWPALGVKTKFDKHATTCLLLIPRLIEIVQDWDCFVRTRLKPTDYWFAHLSPDSGELDSNPKVVGTTRDSKVRRDLKIWLKKCNLPYRSPHSFRHGHATYGLKNAPDMETMKAVSQNLMHSNMNTTDGTYSVLNRNDVGTVYSRLGRQVNSTETSTHEGKDTIQQIRDMLDKLESSQ